MFRERERERMGVSVPVLAVVVSLHLIAFVFAVGAERRRSSVTLSHSLLLCVGGFFLLLFFLILCVRIWELKSLVFSRLCDCVCLFVKAKVVPDMYDEKSYCVYESDASTLYGLTAFGLLLISQALLNAVTRCLCFGKGLVSGRSTTWAVFFFIVSWSVCFKNNYKKETFLFKKIFIWQTIFSSENKWVTYPIPRNTPKS